jgi:hypothetical protein
VKKRGFSLIETVVLLGTASALLVPLLTLSSRNAADRQDQLERALAQSLCLDMVERFKRYKPYWPMPGHLSGPPLEEMFGPIQTAESEGSLFDSAYLNHMASVEMKLVPKLTITPHREKLGLFRLDVSMSWRTHRGTRRTAKYSRWCYAP